MTAWLITTTWTCFSRFLPRSCTMHWLRSPTARNTGTRSCAASLSSAAVSYGGLGNPVRVDQADARSGPDRRNRRTPGPGARRPASALLPPHCARTSGRRSRERVARRRWWMPRRCANSGCSLAVQGDRPVPVRLRPTQRGFRHEYGDAMRQVVRDELVHDHRSAMRILAGELIDVARHRAAYDDGRVR